MTAAPSPLNAALPPGSRVGAYTIESLIAAGEFGFVYLAVDAVLLSKVTVKEYFPQALCTRADGGEVRPRRSAAAADLAALAAGRQAFIEEARLLARLKHPGLVHVLSAFEAHQTAYRVMPYHEGSTLAEQRASWNETPDDEWLRGLLLNLLEPLEALHTAGLVHGHVHPGQVILLEGERPVLLGFGTVPRALHQPMDHGYAPVEQSAIGGQLSRGAWTDIYSLAATAWFAATGRAPVASVDRSVGAAFDIVSPLAEVLGAAAPGREGERRLLIDAMVRALETLPSARPQTDAEFRAALGVEVVPAARRPPMMAAPHPVQTQAPTPTPASAKPEGLAAGPKPQPPARPQAPAQAAPPQAAKQASRPQASAAHAPLRFEGVPERPVAAPAPAAAPAAAPASRKPNPKDEAEDDAAVRAAIFAMVDSIPEREPRKRPPPPRPEHPSAALRPPSGAHPAHGAAGADPARGAAGPHAPQAGAGEPEWDMDTRPAPRGGGGSRKALAWAAALLVSLACAVAAWRWSQAPAGAPTAGTAEGPAARVPPASGRVSTDDALADAEALLSRPPMLQDPPASAAAAVAPAPSPRAASAPGRTPAPTPSPTPEAAPPATAATGNAEAPRTTTPHEVCAGRSNFALHYCMQITCAKGQYSAHPQCREFRAAEAVY